MWLSLVECLNGVQEVAGSNPVIPTKNRRTQYVSVGFLYDEKDLKLKKAKIVKKVAGGKFFRFLVSRRVPKAKLWVVKHARRGAAVSCHSDQKSSFARTGIFTYYLFTIHFSLNTNEDFEVISNSE